MPFISRFLLTCLGATLLWQPLDCAAQAVQPRAALEDAKLYFTAPLHWDGRDWLEFGGTLAAVGVIYQFDSDVRDQMVGADAPLNDEDPYNWDDALPAVAMLAGTWLMAGIVDEPGGWQEVGSMVEATALTVVSTEIFKYSFGRMRPNQTDDPDQWFDGGDSFPSRHVSVAFAIGSVLAESGDDRYRWTRRILGYGLATYTAYARMDHNQHWASDVAAGAALGLATGRFVMRRRDLEHADKLAISVAPGADGGVMLNFSMPLH